MSRYVTLTPPSTDKTSYFNHLMETHFICISFYISFTANSHGVNRAHVCFGSWHDSLCWKQRTKGWRGMITCCPVHKRHRIIRLPSTLQPINHCRCRRAVTESSGHSLMNRERFALQLLKWHSVNSSGTFDHAHPFPMWLRHSRLWVGRDRQKKDSSCPHRQNRFFI